MQRVDLNNRTILVTGSPGFIGANLVIRLLKEMSGGTVVSLDNMNDYYDVSLKEWRLTQVEKAAEQSPVKHAIHDPLCGRCPPVQVSSPVCVFGARAAKVVRSINYKYIR